MISEGSKTASRFSLLHPPHLQLGLLTTWLIWRKRENGRRKSAMLG